MPSDFKKIIHIRFKRFRRWTKSDEFMEFIFKLMAVLIIGLMVFSGFVVMLQ